LTREELLADDTQYCCYCGQEKVKFHCCGENHFQTFAQMSADEQDEFLQDGEEQMSENHVSVKDVYKDATQETHKPWVGLTDKEINYVIETSKNLEGSLVLPYGYARDIEAKLKEKNNG